MSEPIKVIGDVLQSELGLDANQVMLTNQKFPIPNDTKMYIALNYISRKAYSTSARPVATDTGLKEVKEAAMHALVQIDVYAYNKLGGGNDARARLEEVIMAFSSQAMEQAMEANGIQTARNTLDFTDTSELEASQMLTRYTGRTALFYLVTKENASIEYFDKFPTDGTVQAADFRQSLKGE